MIKVKVRLFAVLREAAGRAELELELPEGATCEDAWQRLCDAHETLRARRPSLVAAINRRYAGFGDALREGDELVFVPPVSGGVGERG